jgi:hypothetical protein
MYFVLKSGPDKGAMTLGPGQFGLASEDANCTCALDAQTVDYQPAVIPKGIKQDFSNFNDWYSEKFAA